MSIQNNESSAEVTTSSEVTEFDNTQFDDTQYIDNNKDTNVPDVGFNQKTIRIRPCINKRTGKSVVLGNSSLKIGLIKNSRDQFIFPNSDNPNKFKENYPTLAAEWLYKSNVTEDLVFNKEVLKEFQYTIPAKGKVLDKSEEFDRFILDLLILYPEIGVSKIQQNPDQRYYIEDEEKEAETHVSKAKRKFKAMKAMEELGVVEKRKLAVLYNVDIISVGDTVMEDSLYKAIEDDPDKFMSYLNNKEDTNVRSTIKQASMIGVVRQKNNAYYYNEGFLGQSIDAAVQYLLKPQNQQIWFSIQNDIKEKYKQVV